MSSASQPSTAGPSPPADRLMSSAEIAALFHVSTATVHLWRASGRLPRPTRIGKRFLWRAADVQALIAPPTEAMVALPASEEL